MRRSAVFPIESCTIQFQAGEKARLVVCWICVDFIYANGVFVIVHLLNIQEGSVNSGYPTPNRRHSLPTYGRSLVPIALAPRPGTPSRIGLTREPSAAMQSRVPTSSRKRLADFPANHTETPWNVK